MRGTRKKSVSTSQRVVLGAALLLLACLVIAVFVLFSRSRVASSPEVAARSAAPATIDVLIPIQNLDEGTELKPTMFRKETRAATDGGSVGMVGGFDQISGAHAKSFIAAGQPVLTDHLTFRAPVNSVVPQIRVGYRAITVKLDKQATNEGWARAGVRVDVLWAWKLGNATQASIIAQNVRVLSSGTSVSSEFGGESKIIQNGESTVTLEFSAEDQKR